MSLSEHHYPRRWVRRGVERVLALAVPLTAGAIIAQIGLAFIAGSLLLGTALLTAILFIPLLMRTVLHPEIEVCADGLRLHPILWRDQFVVWDAIVGIVDHPLLFNDEAMGRTLHGKRYRPREGAVILVAGSARLLPLYRILGGVAGANNATAFAISSTTHTDYPLLLEAIRSHLNQPIKDLST
ncbi:MAG: hypothetical protein ABI947_21675 [Chloroflexota bacterium]